MKQTRKTAAKTEILKLIHQSEEALSHADIQTALQGLCDRVTIYRVLDRLIDEGHVHKVVNIDGAARYASCGTCPSHHDHSHQHIHFNCEKCKSVVCIEQVEPSFNLPKKYVVHEVNFTVSGICPKCA